MKTQDRMSRAANRRQLYTSLNELAAPMEGKLDKLQRGVYECCIHGAMEHFGIERRT